MTPASTSPLPAVASAAQAIGLMYVAPSGAAMMVRAPLSTTIAPVAAASRVACPSRSACTVAVGAPVNRPISPGCGVNTRGAVACISTAGASVPSALSASASRTIGCGAVAATRRTTSRMRSPVGMPGPITIACARAASLAIARAAASGSPSSLLAYAAVITSTTFASSAFCPAAVDASVTSPAPARSAACPTSTAAPVFPGEPATTSRWPELVLCADGLRRGRRAPTAAPSSRKLRAPASPGVGSGTPRPTTSTRPTGASASR